MVNTTRKQAVLTARFIDTVGARLTENKRIRRTIPGGGRLHIDRQLPFICIYRKPNKVDDWGTERLAIATASYLFAPATRSMQGSLKSLVRQIADISVSVFGSFLVLEIWSGPTVETGADTAAFRIVRSRDSNIDSTIETLKSALQKIRIPNTASQIDVTVVSRKIAPRDQSPLLTAKESEAVGCIRLGLEIPPIFRADDGNEVYPLVLRNMRRGLQRAFKRTFFEFTRSETTHSPRSYHSLGRRAVVKAVWNVDRKLAEVSNAFDFLLLLTPVNTDTEWSRFKRKRYAVPPRFAYRPLPIDPALVKRKLFECPIEKIEDPTLANLFSQMQQELDRKLTMLADRGTKKLFYGSMQQFGKVGGDLLNTAEDLLKQRSTARRLKNNRAVVTAEEFAVQAEKEIAFYRATHPEVSARVEIRQDVAGLMVSRGNLLIGTSTKIAESRVRALIQHEVGTHILTYTNGAAQPFRTLQLGLPGYEELQEGLAVLAEYLVGGLSVDRLRLLAARVVAVHRMIEGVSFINVFEELHKAHRFDGRTAFVIEMRVFRGGGLTKDAVYLKGLVELLKYLSEGEKIEPLLIGKMAIDHVPIMQELLARGVLVQAPLRPRYLDEEIPKIRLEGIARGISIFELTKG